MMTWSLTVFVLAVLAFATRYGQHFARSVMFGWVVLAPTLIGLSRMSLRIVQKGLLSRGVGIRRVAIAGFKRAWSTDRCQHHRRRRPRTAGRRLL